MTLSDLASEVSVEFGEDYTDTDVADQYVAWGNESYQEIIGSGRWYLSNKEETFTLSNGVSVYSMPVGVAEIVQLSNKSTNLPISYIPMERLVARKKNLDASGAPTNWWYDGFDGTTKQLKVRVYPVPGAGNDSDVIRTNTLQSPAVLAATDEIPLPNEYLHIMRNGIRSKQKFSDGDLEGATAARGLFTNGLGLLNQRYSGAPKQGSRINAKRRLRAVEQAPAAAGYSDASR